MSNNPTTINNENEYLEFSNLMKEQYEELEKENKKLIIKNNKLKKELCSLYGVSRVIDYMASSLLNIPNILLELIERQRSALSIIVETEILNIPEEEDEEIEVVMQMVFNDD